MLPPPPPRRRSAKTAPPPPSWVDGTASSRQTTMTSVSTFVIRRRGVVLDRRIEASDCRSEMRPTDFKEPSSTPSATGHNVRRQLGLIFFLVMITYRHKYT